MAYLSQDLRIPFKMQVSLGKGNFNLMLLELLVNPKIELADQHTLFMQKAGTPDPQLKLKSAVAKLKKANAWRPSRRASR